MEYLRLPAKGAFEFLFNILGIHFVGEAELSPYATTSLFILLFLGVVVAVDVPEFTWLRLFVKVPYTHISLYPIHVLVIDKDNNSLGDYFLAVVLFVIVEKSVIFTLAIAKCFNINDFRVSTMYWTLELASKLDDAPWPATKDELIDYAQRTCAPMEVIENLQEIEDDEMIYDNIEEIWPDYPSKEDFFFNEEEY